MSVFDHAKDALNSDKGEEVSDSVIDRAEEAASRKSGGKFDDKLEQAGDAADDKVGKEG